MDFRTQRHKDTKMLRLAERPLVPFGAASNSGIQGDRAASPQARHLRVFVSLCESNLRKAAA
jgi:hypothetical protein